MPDHGAAHRQLVLHSCVHSSEVRGLGHILTIRPPNIKFSRVKTTGKWLFDLHKPKPHFSDDCFATASLIVLENMGRSRVLQRRGKAGAGGHSLGVDV